MTFFILGMFKNNRIKLFFYIIYELTFLSINFGVSHTTQFSLQKFLPTHIFAALSYQRHSRTLILRQKMQLNQTIEKAPRENPNEIISVC